MRRQLLFVIAVALPAMGMSVALPAAASAAKAATTITASVSADTVREGHAITIKGRARGAAASSRVVLQQRDGSAWVRVKATTIDARADYAFKVRPDRGTLRYRVVLPAQSGRPEAVSGTLKVVVTWQPQMLVGLKWLATPAGGRELRVNGTTDYAGAGKALLQTNSGFGWVGAGYVTLDKGHFQQVLALPPAPGDQVRAVLAASGVREEAVGMAVTPDPLPYVLDVNDPDGLVIAPPTSVVTVLVQATGGDFVSVGYEGNELSNITVVDDQGIPLPEPGDEEPPVDNAIHFNARSDGTYTLNLPAYSSVPLKLWASTPKHYTGHVDSAVDVSADLPFQPVDVTFTGTADSTVTLPALDARAGELIGPDGMVQPWLETPDAPDVYRLPDDGSYTFRLFDTSVTKAKILSTEETSAAIGDNVSLTLADVDKVAVVTIPATAGDCFFVDALVLGLDRGYTMFAPDGSEMGRGLQVDEAVTGDYLLLVAGDATSPEVTVSVAPPEDVIVN